MNEEHLVRTRNALHAVAEHLLAGPQHRRDGDIRLRVAPGGFATWTEPATAVVGVDVVHDGRAVPVDGRTTRRLGEELGLGAGAPVGVYGTGAPSGVDDVLAVDPAAAAVLAAAYATGDAALRLLAPGAEPTLWPEHFDVAVEVGGVDFGVSPGDGFLAQPYAYASVGRVEPDPFWNAPFGAARPVAELGDVAAVLAFLREARERLS